TNRDACLQVIKDKRRKCCWYEYWPSSLRDQQQYRCQKRATRPERPDCLGMQHQRPYQPWSKVRERSHEAGQDHCSNRRSRVPCAQKSKGAVAFHGYPPSCGEETPLSALEQGHP